VVRAEVVVPIIAVFIDAAAKIARSIYVVVVFPFVPVTAISRNFDAGESLKLEYMKADARLVFDTIIKGRADDEQSPIIPSFSKPSSATMSDAPELIAEGIKS
jgi:hypothetical protein